MTTETYQDAIDVLEAEIPQADHPKNDALRYARRVLLREDGRADAPPVPSGTNER